MLTIHLTNLLFHAYHGLYEDEKKIGGSYEINVSVSHYPAAVPVMHIHETIDYTAVYALLLKHMQQPKLLLETVTTIIVEDIFDSFPQAAEVSISIRKINPPVVAFRGSVGVSYTATRKKEVL